MNKGFTLFEMLVAVFIFSIVVLIAMNALVGIIGAQRKATSVQNIQDNVRFALEFMTRAIRTGQVLSCGQIQFAVPRDCAGSDSLLAFTASDGAQTVFRLFNNRIEFSNDSGGSFGAITASEVRIDRLRFYVVGGEIADLQTRVTVSLGATIEPGTKNEKTINIQTSVTPRTLDE